MRSLKNLVLFLLLASAQFGYSAESCKPCDPCYSATECDLCNFSFCDLDFKLYADALYWHADADSHYPRESNHALCPDYAWGWRIGGSVNWNCWDVGVRYTSIHPSAEKLNIFELSDEIEIETEPTEMSPKQIVIELDSFKKEIDYRVFDFEVGRSCCICSGMLFRPFIGGKFADIKLTSEFDILLLSDDYYERKFEGCGLYAGADFRWQICSFSVCDYNIPIAFVSRVSTGVMDGDFEQVDGGDNENIQKDCQFIPVHDVYAGLEFRMRGLCNADAFMQIGYEAQYWGWRESNSDSDIAHLGLGGLVLRFGAHF